MFFKNSSHVIARHETTYIRDNLQSLFGVPKQLFYTNDFCSLNFLKDSPTDNLRKSKIGISSGALHYIYDVRHGYFITGIASDVLK